MPLAVARLTIDIFTEARSIGKIDGFFQ